MMQKIEMHEIRKLLIAVETLAVRPAQADEKTIGEAIGYFKKLVDERTHGAIQIVMFVDGKLVA
ncbi:hypothetical protein [Acinetobacter harbinensis]